MSFFRWKSMSGCIGKPLELGSTVCLPHVFNYTKKWSAHLRATSSFPCSRFQKFQPTLWDALWYLWDTFCAFCFFCSGHSNSGGILTYRYKNRRIKIRCRGRGRGQGGLVVIINNNQFPVCPKCFPSLHNISTFPFFHFSSWMQCNCKFFRIWWENWNKIWQHNERGDCRTKTKKPHKPLHKKKKVKSKEHERWGAAGWLFQIYLLFAVFFFSFYCWSTIRLLNICAHLFASFASIGPQSADPPPYPVGCQWGAFFSERWRDSGSARWALRLASRCRGVRRLSVGPINGHASLPHLLPMTHAPSMG